MKRALDWDAVRRTATDLHVRYRGADPVRAVREAVALAEAVEEYRLGYEGEPCPDCGGDGVARHEDGRRSEFACLGCLRSRDAAVPANLDLLACFYIVHEARISSADGAWAQFCTAHNVSPRDLAEEVRHQHQMSKAFLGSKLIPLPGHRSGPPPAEEAP